MSEVVNSRDQSVKLGDVLGNGYEGTVYEVMHSGTTVAKLYHRPLTQDRSEKIVAMPGLGTDALARLTAWPTDVLRAKGGGPPIGFLMPRIANKKDIHHLYGPKSRLQDFPRADWRVLVRAAANTARAFAVVHHADYVIGDVNYKSIMVADDATVSLIDCDSFQIRVLISTEN